MNFYYDTSKLKREWSKDNLSNFADFLSEVMRSENYYKDGWSNGFVEEFYDKPDDPYADLDDEEYQEMLQAKENAESMYWDQKIDEARGN